MVTTNWSADLRSTDIEQDLVGRVARRMAAEIDWELTANMLTDSGWSKVVLQPMIHEQGDAIDLWTHKHCKGQYKTKGLVWIFASPQDAMWFKLRWMSNDQC